MAPPIAALKRNIHLSHAKQLAHLQLLPAPDSRKEDPPPSLLQIISGWIQDNTEAIKAAQNSQCNSAGPDSPNWDAVLFTLVESTALLLRQYDQVAEAAKAASEGDLEKAADHLEKSQDEIDIVAELLDCTFLQLCDFVTRSPDGSPSLSGAFCGLFISNSTDKPFMGIACKGTNTNPELVTDLLWAPIKPYRPEVAWGALMHAGFYQGMFGTFTTEGSDPQVPFDLMLQTLSDTYTAHPDAQLHFTGHSLGGAYCIITYGEFLRRQAESAFANFKFGDMYAFAAPRVCLTPFAENFNTCTEASDGTKNSFRIVNMQDPVPTLPPAFADQLQEFPFIHPGRAWRIKTDGPPEKMVDEPPTENPQSILDIPNTAHFHGNDEYYASWQKTPHS